MTAQLNASVFFAGSFVYCEVKVRTNGFFVLEGTVAGVRQVDRQWVADETLNGEAVLLGCRVPTVLGCEIESEEIRDHCYLFYCELPLELIPSFHGRIFKLLYSIVIKAQVGQAKHILKIPFRVIRRSRLDHIDLKAPLLHPLKLGRSHGPLLLAHPEDVFGFVEIVEQIEFDRILLARANDDDGEPIEWALSLPCHHNPLTRDSPVGDFHRRHLENAAFIFFEKAIPVIKKYAVQRNNHRVLDWHMDHSLVYLEGRISGVLNFHFAEIQCYEIHVALLRRETVFEKNKSKPVILDHVVDEKTVQSFNALKIPIELLFPRNHCQTFSTHDFAVRWTLSFIFFVARRPLDAEKDDEIFNSEFLAENNAEIDRMEWELDVPVICGPVIPHELRNEPKIKVINV